MERIKGNSMTRPELTSIIAKALQTLIRVSEERLANSTDEKEKAELKKIIHDAMEATK